VPSRSRECAQALFDFATFAETFDEVTPCSSAAIKASITHEITFDHCGSSSRVADARGSREMTSGSSKNPYFSVFSLEATNGEAPTSCSLDHVHGFTRADFG
jgi:hypothetical protein